MSADVRLATRADAARLLELQLALDEQTSFMLLEPGERTTTERQLAERLGACRQGEGGYFLLADPGEGEPLAGYVGVDVPAPRRARFTGYLVMGVRAEHAGRGVGRALLTAAVEEARRRGLRRLELTVMSHNEVAHRLYLSCGFVDEGVRRRALDVDGRPVDEYYMGLLL